MKDDRILGPIEAMFAMSDSKAEQAEIFENITTHYQDMINALGKKLEEREERIEYLGELIRRHKCRER